MYMKGQDLLLTRKPDMAFKQKIDRIILDGKNRETIEMLQHVDKFAVEQNRDFYETTFMIFGLLRFFGDHR